MIKLTDSKFHTNKTWSTPIESGFTVPIEHSDWVSIFDQNGYRLTKLESHYAGANNHPITLHRHEVSLRQDWFTDDKPNTGAHINHAFLFERKGYQGEALNQLKEFAKVNHLIHKLIDYRGKWGVDLSIDYVDAGGNSMELLHFEFDSFNANEISDIKGRVETIVEAVDWEFASKLILERKAEWIDLEFFDQSKWKTDFFNLPAERFKVNAWD